MFIFRHNLEKFDEVKYLFNNWIDCIKTIKINEFITICKKLFEIIVYIIYIKIKYIHTFDDLFLISLKTVK